MLKNPAFTTKNPQVAAAKAAIGKRATVAHAGTYGATVGTAGSGNKASVYLAPTGIVCWVGTAPKTAFKKPRGLKKANLVATLAAKGATVAQVRTALKACKYRNPKTGKFTPVGTNLNWLIAHGYVAIVQNTPAIRQQG
jgi:hypothetical protein